MPPGKGKRRGNWCAAAGRGPPGARTSCAASAISSLCMTPAHRLVCALVRAFSAVLTILWNTQSNTSPAGCGLRVQGSGFKVRGPVSRAFRASWTPGPVGLPGRWGSRASGAPGPVGLPGQWGSRGRTIAGSRDEGGKSANRAMPSRHCGARRRAGVGRAAPGAVHQHGAVRLRVVRLQSVLRHLRWTPPSPSLVSICPVSSCPVGLARNGRARAAHAACGCCGRRNPQKPMRPCRSYDMIPWDTIG